MIAAYESSIPWTVAAVLATHARDVPRRRRRLGARVGARRRSASPCSASSGSATASRSRCCCAGSQGPNHFGFNVLLAVLIGTWASDIFAYFGGRLFGKRRLAPAISPNKTVEGFLIGLVFGTAAGWLTLYDQDLTRLQALEVALAIALAGPLGDLFESFVKRDLNVKDSGTLLGGHGGVLDRIDALLFSSAAAYFTLLALGRA